MPASSLFVPSRAFMTVLVEAKPEVVRDAEEDLNLFVRVHADEALSGILVSHPKGVYHHAMTRHDNHVVGKMLAVSEQVRRHIIDTTQSDDIAVVVHTRPIFAINDRLDDDSVVAHIGRDALIKSLSFYDIVIAQQQKRRV